MQRLKTTMSDLITSLPDGRKDEIGFFERIKFAGLEEVPFRLCAEIQREHFGCVPFGKRQIRVVDNEVTVSWTSGFGQDFEYVSLRWSMADKAWFDDDGRLYDVFPKG